MKQRNSRAKGLVMMGLTTLIWIGCGSGVEPEEGAPEPSGALEEAQLEAELDARFTDGEDVTPALAQTRRQGVEQAAPHEFWLGGQRAWFHDEGSPYGFFHTYDAFKVCGSQDTPRKVHVFLPRRYEERRQRYPVVYMQDGNTTFWSGGAAGKSWQVAQTLGELAEAGQIEPVIVVAIHPLDREREYTHTGWAPGRAWGGLDGYTGYVADCVKGFVDAHYHTDPTPARTAVVGSSHGGLAAFYMGTRRPDAFGMVGALSPSFWVGVDQLELAWLGGDGGQDLDALRSSELVRGAAPTLQDSDRRPRVWIDWGLRRDGGFHNSAIEKLATRRGRSMATILERDYGYASDQELFTHEDPRGGHDEDAWAWRFRGMMRAFYGR